ncbi:hypothetical protein [Sulfurovum sp. TSL1]|uniref:hypothetical protein n=1 Tax=Sulfurovum sp. TSL1 TaxID=2826994 RepID=UPI001CC33A90|nr:hypothetical protein [Sulfurovum sp. TSL1]GIT99383.1 hypothetical protein TSL1_22040 [Sulfurovum sp. TSL1]
MFIISDSRWNRLPISDFRGRFFVETCYELLHTETPPFHQSRLMNIISSVEEVLFSIEDFEYEVKNFSNLQNAIDELKSCFQIDFIAKEILSEDILNLNGVFSDIKTYNEATLSRLKKVKLLCNNILYKEADYSQRLTQKLQEIVIGDSVNVEQKHRLTKEIYKTTSLYITYLLSKGYSPKYLYNRTESFTRLNNYRRGRNFNEQFSNVIAKLNSRIDKYTICFALYTSHISDIDTYSEVFGVSILDDVSHLFNAGDIRKINPENEYNMYILINVETTDYVSASFEAKEIFNSIIDSFSFNDLIYNKDINDVCLTHVTINSNIYRRELDLGTLWHFVTISPNKEYYRHLDLMLNLDTYLEKTSSEKLKRSLRYVRLSKDANSLEQKLLNLWIALESLFDNKQNTIIGNVLDYIPEVYAVNSIENRLKYILELLSKYKVTVPIDVKNKYTIIDSIFSEDISLSVFTRLFYDEDSMVKVFDSCGEKEFLKYRLLTIYEELNNTKKIIARIKKTSLDVRRQLRRIYVIRNKLTHQAYHRDIKGQIVNHLFEYTMMCYNAIFITMKNSQEARKITIDDALLAYKLGSQNIFKHLSEIDDETTTIDYSLINVKPVI